MVKRGPGSYLVARAKEPEWEMDDTWRQPVTRAVSHALREVNDPRAWSDLLFLEAWELHRPRDLGASLRANQIRRANPDLAAAIERELKNAR